MSSSSSSSPSPAQDLVSEFVSITGAPASVAESLLAICNNNLEMAINMQMEGIDVRDDGSSEAGGAGTSSNSNFENPLLPGDSSQSSFSPVGEGGEEDEVRAPIPQKQETLIGPGYEGYALPNRTQRNPHKARIRSVFDGFRNFGNESGPSNPRSAEGRLPVSRSKKRTLEELFKPPLDLIHKGDFQSARDTATAAKKWLLINIQDAGEFQCQVLNRDVWSSEAVKTILREHFIFWQQYKESDEAQRYMTFYPVMNWPYVTVLDPRTGEKMVEWNRLDSAVFCELVADFLSVHPHLDGGGYVAERDRESSSLQIDNSPPPQKKSKAEEERSIIDADEDDQLRAAIQASLAAEKAKEERRFVSLDSGSDSDLAFEDEDSNLSGVSPVKKPPPPHPETKSSSDHTNGKESKNGDLDERKDASESCSSKDSTNNGENWEKYLGDESEPKSSIMIRFPDGKRDAKKLPSNSKLLAIILYVVSQGFPLESYEIVTNFPRRILSDLDDGKTLKEHGLFPQETIFVQKR